MKALQKSYGSKILALAPLDEHFSNIKQKLGTEGIDLYPIKFSNTSVSPFSDSVYLWKLYQFLRREKPDGVFTMTIKPVIYGILAAYLAGVPKRFAIMTGLGHVYTFDNLKAKCVRHIVNMLYRISLPHAHRIFFQNPDDLAVFEGLGLIKNDQGVITPGSGVNLNAFPHKPLAPYPPLRFLFIGRLLKAKGIEEYCDAVEELKTQHPSAVFQVLGGVHHNPSTLEKETLLKRFKNLGIDYLGEQPSSAPYLDKAQVVVLPSYREGTPRALLEALATGRAIITTDAPGCRETLVDGVNGIMVKPQDSRDLARAMGYLLDHPELIEPMGKASYQLALEKFDVNRVNDLIISKIN